MELRIKKIELHNFKGIADATYDFDGNSAVVSGENGTGKTTMADCYYWLFDDVDYALNSNPNIRPIGADDTVIPEVVITIECDGKEIVCVKRQKCKTTEDLAGAKKVALTNEFMVNGIKKSKKDFISYFTLLGLNLDYFLALSHPQAFTSEKAEDMRKVLFGMVDGVTDYQIASASDEYKEVADLLGKGYSLDEIKAMAQQKIREIKAKYGDNGELLDAQSKILEQQKSPVEVAEAELAVNSASGAYKDAQERYNNYGSSSRIDELMAESMQIQFDIQDLSNKANADVYKRKEEIGARLFELKSALDRNRFEITSANNQLSLTVNQLTFDERERDKCREDWKKIKASKIDPNAVACPTCGREYPAENVEIILADFETNKAKQLELISDKGNAYKAEIAKLQASVDSYKAEIERLSEQAKNLENEAIKLNDEAETLLMVDVKTLPEYKALVEKDAEIKKQIEDIKNGSQAEKDKAKYEFEDAALELSKARTQLELAKKNTEIDEKIASLKSAKLLYAQEKANAQKIIFQLDRINLAKNTAYSDAINACFEDVSFRLFEYQKNGEVKNVCVPIVDGKSINGESNHALRTMAQLNIIKGLQTFYKCKLPVFVDDAEHFTTNTTGRIKSDCQMIYLTAKECKKLEVKNI